MGMAEEFQRYISAQLKPEFPEVNAELSSIRGRYDNEMKRMDEQMENQFREILLQYESKVVNKSRYM